MPRSGWIVVAACMAVLAVTPETAMAQLELAVSGGLYLPAGTVAEGRAQIGAQVADAVWTQQDEFAVGARGTYWFARRLGVEASLLHAQSDLDLLVSGSSIRFSQRTSANLTAATLRLALRFGSEPSQGGVAYHLQGGAGLLLRGGAAWRDFENTTAFTGVVGAGLTVRLASAFGLRLDIEDYVHSTGLEFIPPEDSFVEPGVATPGLRNDFVLTQSLVVAF